MNLTGRWKRAGEKRLPAESWEDHGDRAGRCT
jgi:hypothetical protein